MKHFLSRFLKSVAGFFLVFPIAYIILAATLFDIPLNRCVGILLSPFYYVVSISVLVTGYGLWEGQRWAWYLLITSQILVGYENALLVQNYSESHNKLLAFLLSLFIQAGVIYRISRELRVPYFFPNIRWWESNPRYRLNVPINLTRKSGQAIEGSILDLSIVGCFIKTREDLEQGESLSLQFRIFDVPVQCDGTVVWSAISTVTHPKGIGVKFHVTQKAQRRILRLINRRLKKMAALYRRYRYLMNQDEFISKLDEIESADLRIR